MARTYQTMAEIEKLYPNEWVLIDDPKTTKYQVVLGGYVVTHGADKLAIYEEVNKLSRSPSTSQCVTTVRCAIPVKRSSSMWGSSCEVHLRCSRLLGSVDGLKHLASENAIVPFGQCLIANLFSLGLLSRASQDFHQPARASLEFAVA